MAIKTNLLHLLKANDEFVVPTIQRDYAQGRNHGSNKDLCEEVRTGLIESLYNALINDEFLLLDYIYGTIDSKIFYPIDGQQRLTTLFLLHWYIGKKEEVNETLPDEFNLLRKFSYEIRDTSKEFCKSLIDVNINICEETISNQIKDSSKYHDSYNFDPTVLSMLTVIDTIHSQFKDAQIQLWKRLNKIEFWCLSLEHFGLTDDLFVKMNARGKRLTRFDVFKSDLESKIENVHHKDGETWKTEIDNTYLDAFWNKFGFGLSERNLFRTILFYVKALISAKDTSIKYDDSWEINDLNVNYNDVILQIENDSDVLTRICHLLSNFDAWKDTVNGTELFIDSAASDQTNILGYKKVIVFGILHWFSYGCGIAADRNFDEFKRILENYVFSLRQPNIWPAKRFYSSSIDNGNVGKSFLFIKTVIDGYNRSCTFNDYILGSSYSELGYEREKLIYKPLTEIMELENISFLKKNITNFYFGGRVYLNASEVNYIAANDTLVNKSLRIIYSYADDCYGQFRDLLLDKTLIKSGHKQLYYNNENDQATGYMHKWSFKKTDSDTIAFGDRNLTASGNDVYRDISGCVKDFVENLSAKIHTCGLSIESAIDELLSERIAKSNFKDSLNVKWYIVKYEEFFYSKTGTTLSVLRRKNYGGIDDDNVYDMQCLDDSNNFNEPHYHPFYLALKNKLTNHVNIISPLKYSGVQIEYANPCILSNGWMIRINKDGNWSIDFNGVIPTAPIFGITIGPSGEGEVDCTGVDSIETFAAILNLL